MTFVGAIPELQLIAEERVSSIYLEDLVCGLMESVSTGRTVSLSPKNSWTRKQLQLLTIYQVTRTMYTTFSCHGPYDEMMRLPMAYNSEMRDNFHDIDIH